MLEIGVEIDMWLIVSWLVESCGLLNIYQILLKLMIFILWLNFEEKYMYVEIEEIQSWLWKMYRIHMFVTDWVTE